MRKQRGKNSRQPFIRANHRIRVPEIRLIDSQGNTGGVIKTSEAQARAREAGLDLVEVSPTANPPVCRIMDLGKFRYDEKRKTKHAKKSQQNHAVKEIKFHVNVDQHDYETKVQHAKGFLSKGHKVKLSLLFRGRENAHRELGFEVIKQVIEDCSDIATVEMPPRMMGRILVSMVAPIATKGRKAKSRKPAKPATEAKAGSEEAAKAPAAPDAEKVEAEKAGEEEVAKPAEPVAASAAKAD